MTKEGEKHILSVKRRFKNKYGESKWVRFYYLNFVRGFSVREVGIMLKMDRGSVEYWKNEIKLYDTRNSETSMNTG